MVDVQDPNGQATDAPTKRTPTLPIDIARALALLDDLRDEILAGVEEPAVEPDPEPEPPVEEPEPVDPEPVPEPTTPRIFLSDVPDLNGATVGDTLFVQSTIPGLTKWVLDGVYQGAGIGGRFITVKPGVHKIRAKDADGNGEITATFTVVTTDAPAPVEEPTPPVVVTEPQPPVTPTLPAAFTRAPSDAPSISGAYIRVRTADALTEALAYAPAGGLIVVSAGAVLPGRFVLPRPLNLVFEDGAGIDGGAITNGYALHLKDAPGSTVYGGEVFGAQKGIMLDGSSRSKILGVHVHSTGMEAVHVRGFSSDVEVSRLLVEHTGLDPAKEEGMGEGIYIGSAKSNWSTWSGGKPDASDRTLVLQNVVRDVPGECLDVKEGTVEGLIEGNVFDGARARGNHFADSCADFKGNRYLIRANVFQNGLLDLVQTHSQSSGYGHDNVFESNVFEDAPGFAIRDHTKVSGTVVRGVNVLTRVAGGLYIR